MACMGTWATRSDESAHAMPSGLLKAATQSLYLSMADPLKHFCQLQVYDKVINIGMHGNLGGKWASDESAHT